MALPISVSSTGLVPVTRAVVPAYASSDVTARLRKGFSLLKHPRRGSAWMAGTSPAKVSFGAGLS